MEYTVHFGDDALDELKKAIGAYGVTPLEVTANGVYTADELMAFNPVTVNVAGGDASKNAMELKKVTLTNRCNRSVNVSAIWSGKSYTTRNVADREVVEIYVPVYNGKMNGVLCVIEDTGDGSGESVLNYTGIAYYPDGSFDWVNEYYDGYRNDSCFVSFGEIDDDMELFIKDKVM